MRAATRRPTALSKPVGRRAAIVVVLALAAMLPATAVPAHAQPTAPAIYFVPHQDDETLIMGASIEEHVAAGRIVHIVVVTDGGASRVRAVLAGEGYVLTRAQFVAARNREIVAAARRLGVPWWRVHFEDVLDGTLTVATATRIATKWATLYPGASLKTTSAHDALSDHVNMAKGVAATVSNDKRYLQYRHYWSTMPVSGWFTTGYAPVRYAVNEYRVWNPSIGRYAIGWTSVSSDFQALLADPLLRCKTSTVP